MKTNTFSGLLRKQFPPNVVLVHFILFSIAAIIIVPLLFTEVLGSNKLGFIVFLALYSLFILAFTLLALFQLYSWHLKKEKWMRLLQKFNPVLIENKTVVFKTDASLTRLKKYVFGNIPTLSEIGFNQCDIIKTDRSVIIFGKGENTVIPKGKGVYHPFEISYTNEFLTGLNKAYLKEHRADASNTTFELEVSGLYGAFGFEMVIEDFLIHPPL
ncbi:hypothetical protein [Sinomicrobium sp. M5D2P17]